MKFSTNILSRSITQLCLANEIDHIVISPGSRNAPLIIGFTEQPDFKCFSIVDERCAAFFAIGLAQQLKKPVAVVCTSGSALLNYYPAIAEAFYSDIPLVIISADRPSHLLEIGDGQTIRQENVFANHILFNGNCKDGGDSFENEVIIDEALKTAIHKRGPVHINAPFSEPLYEQTLESVLKQSGVGKEDNVSPESFSEDLEPFAKIWNSSSRKMILVGVLDPESIEQRFLDLLAKDKSVIVLTEVTSNLHHEQFFPAIDQLIASLNDNEFQDLRPEILLTFGGMVVSKKIKAFLREYSPLEHWHVDVKKAYDTYFCLKEHFKIRPNQFFKLFLPLVKEVPGLYQTSWEEVKTQRLTRHNIFEKEVVYSDFRVFSEVFRTLPPHFQLQLGNSATVRYAQLFALEVSLRVYCNRGTSGIDGSLSTAIGAAFVSKLPTVFVTGDLSFLYDSNGLWNNYIPKSFRIVLINNGGGGIFRILPGAKKAQYFSDFFETKHSLTAEHLCNMYDIEYASAIDYETIKLQIADFYKASKRPKLIEIFTPSNINDQVLKDYFQFIS
ncbi:MAG: 2-succinyl-5-enolpyruvyl-6-hydroxy-3-cyclohexene-1-carboxylate synthase [Flavobacteriaceae bacterium]|jgi:2-succinyl-5-enolpyruvyl-6-hydroxy-3-cyclohexene-1-carboxylate synthase